jgi:formylmethanofuran dehydrogenase subunit E
MDVEAIMQIPISHTTHQDIWAWHYEKTGVFSVRSTYKMLIETKQRRENWLEGRAASSSTEEDENQWKKLWQTRLPSKLQIFAWRLARLSLPTGQEREHRHMSTTSACSICNEPVDDWRHSLVECNMARVVWALMDDDLVDSL